MVPRSVKIMRLLTFPLVGVFVTLFALPGNCQTAAESPSPDPPAPTRQPAVETGPDYRIGPGDVLHISVWEEPRLSVSAIVRPDGKISVPLISDVAVAGLTTEAAQDVLTQKLDDFVKKPRVTVIVEEIHSRVVYVIGEVEHPGAYPLLGEMNVIQLIARAGGLTEFAKKKDIYVLPHGGGAKVKVNYQMVMAGKHLEQNVVLNPSDTVVVP